MSNTTVSLSQPVDSCPPCLRDLAAGEPSHCVCGSFMTALCYTSARLSPGCTEEVGEGGFRDAGQRSSVTGPRSPKPLPRRPSCGFPKNSSNCQWCTRSRVCYYRCAVLCVHTESGSSFNRPGCTTALHTQASTLRPPLWLMEAQHWLVELRRNTFFPLQQRQIPSFPYAASAVFFFSSTAYSPEITFIFKLAPSKVSLSGGC